MKSTVIFPETLCRLILHSNMFRTQTRETRHDRSATGRSWVTGTLVCRTSYCTRRSETSFYGWTAAVSTTCVRSVDAWHNTTINWPTSCTTSGPIFYSKSPATAPTTHAEVITTRGKVRDRSAAEKFTGDERNSKPTSDAQINWSHQSKKRWQCNVIHRRSSSEVNSRRHTAHHYHHHHHHHRHSSINNTLFLRPVSGKKSRYQCWNKNVFRCWLKTESDGTEAMSDVSSALSYIGWHQRP